MDESKPPILQYVVSLPQYLSSLYYSEPTNILPGTRYFLFKAHHNTSLPLRPLVDPTPRRHSIPMSSASALLCLPSSP